VYGALPAARAICQGLLEMLLLAARDGVRKPGAIAVVHQVHALVGGPAAVLMARKHLYSAGGMGKQGR
jgi:hypothetical protein